MILQALTRYYDLMAEKGEIPVVGWIDKMVDWAIEIDAKGELKAVHHLKRVISIPAPIRATSDKTANLLCDDGRYFLGFNDKGKVIFPSILFQKSKELHIDFLSSIDTIEAKAICAFFSNWEQSYEKYSDLVSQLSVKDVLVFLIEGKFALDIQPIRQKYSEYYQEKNATGQKCRCLISGDMEYPCRIHPANFNVPKGTNPKLVSFDSDTTSLYSFGTDGKQALCVPIGNITAQKYGNTLRYLLNSRHNQYIVGKNKVVFWSEAATKDNESIFINCMEPVSDNAITDEELLTIVHSVLSGTRLDIAELPESVETPFYIVVLYCPSKGRIAVRSFLKSSFGDLLKNIALHQGRVALKPWKSSQRELSPFVFCTSFMEEVGSKIDMKKIDVSEQRLYLSAQQAIFTDLKYPYVLYNRILNAILSSKDIEEKLYERTAAIKAILTKNNGLRLEEAYMQDGQSNAYYLGAMFATIEEAKNAADRAAGGWDFEKRGKSDESESAESNFKRAYFHAACTAPRTVFPKMITKLMPHYERIISRSVPAYAKSLENAMSEVHEHITSYPAHQSSEDQGLFIIGYYQRKAYRKQKGNSNKSIIIENTEEDIDNE